MNEEEQKGKGKEPEATIENKEVRLSPKEERAKHIKEIKESNAELKDLLAEERELQAQRNLSGEGGGRVETKVIPEADRKKQEAAEFFKGTALEKAILPDEKK